MIGPGIAGRRRKGAVEGGDLGVCLGLVDPDG